MIRRNFYILRRARFSRLLPQRCRKQLHCISGDTRYGQRIIPHATGIGFGWNLAASDSSVWLLSRLFPSDETTVLYPRRIKNWETLAVWLGIMESKGQAKKNGWAGPLPVGYSERRVKSLGQVVYLYVPGTNVGRDRG